eukprot:1146007-Pelagomonas_calceolata.AAC.1
MPQTLCCCASTCTCSSALWTCLQLGQTQAWMAVEDEEEEGSSSGGKDCLTGDENNAGEAAKVETRGPWMSLQGPARRRISLRLANSHVEQTRLNVVFLRINTEANQACALQEPAFLEPQKTRGTQA